MRDKNKAGLLAIFLGMFGIHRFYLGQTFLGIVYCLFFWVTWMLGILDGIILLTMDEQDFDYKYNRNKVEVRRRDTDFNRKKERADYDRKRSKTTRREERKTRKEAKKAPPTRRNTTTKIRGNANEWKEKGKAAFLEYDYEEAIEMYEKALKINEKDIAVHFNLACTQSLMENADRAFYHLERAVAYGFTDRDLIRTKDHLAWLRIHPDFEAFEKNNYQKVKTSASPKKSNMEVDGNILEQLSRLESLRERGLLTEREYLAEKERISR